MIQVYLKVNYTEELKHNSVVACVKPPRPSPSALQVSYVQNACIQ